MEDKKKHFSLSLLEEEQVWTFYPLPSGERVG